MSKPYAQFYASLRDLGPAGSYEEAVRRTNKLMIEAGIPERVRAQSQARAQAQLPGVAALTEDERKVCKLMGTDPTAYAAQKQRDIESKSRLAPPVAHAAKQVAKPSRAHVESILPFRSATEIDAIMATYDGPDAA
jgi:hypothetical protein